MYWADLAAGAEKTAIAFGVLLAFVLLVFVALRLVAHVFSVIIQSIPLICGVTAVFGSLALVTGMITGASRSAAVGQVLPAALGLIGAVALFVLTKVKSESLVAGTAVISFSVMLLNVTTRTAPEGASLVLLYATVFRSVSASVLVKPAAFDTVTVAELPETDTL